MTEQDLSSIINEKIAPHTVSGAFAEICKRYLTLYSEDVIRNGVEIAAKEYLKRNENGYLGQAYINDFFRKLEGVFKNLSTGPLDKMRWRVINFARKRFPELPEKSVLAAISTFESAVKNSVIPESAIECMLAGFGQRVYEVKDGEEFLSYIHSVTTQILKSLARQQTIKEEETARQNQESDDDLHLPRPTIFDGKHYVQMYVSLDEKRDQLREESEGKQPDYKSFDYQDGFLSGQLEAIRDNLLCYYSDLNTWEFNEIIKTAKRSSRH